MKRSILLLVLGAALIAISAPAQTDRATAAAVIAAQEENETRFRRLNNDIEELIAANKALQSRLSEMSEEIRKLKRTQARAADDTTIQADLRRLADAIQEVDRKREADRKVILEQMGKLEKLLTAPPPAPAAKLADPPSRPVEGFRYVVKQGDTLYDIVDHYNREFQRQAMKQITVKQTLDANPGLVSDRMRVGQTIVIPDPGK